MPYHIMINTKIKTCVSENIEIESMRRTGMKHQCFMGNVMHYFLRYTKYSYIVELQWLEQ